LVFIFQAFTPKNSKQYTSLQRFFIYSSKENLRQEKVEQQQRLPVGNVLELGCTNNLQKAQKDFSSRLVVE